MRNVSENLIRLSVLALIHFALAGGAVAQQSAAIEEIGSSSNAPKSLRTLTQKAAPVVNATAQLRSAPTGSLEDRIKRLERMVDNKALVGILRRLNEVQQENETLRSEIEEMSNVISGLKRRQRDIYNDIDRRMQRLEGRSSSVATSPKTVGASSTTIRSGQEGEAAARKAYEQAFAVLRKKQYDDAITQFKDLVARYPQSSLADNALYWQGEANRVTRRFSQAVDDFNTLIKNYPQSAKLADAYYKLGVSHYQLSHFSKAKQAFKTVRKKYPTSSSARLSKAQLKKLKKEGH